MSNYPKTISGYYEIALAVAETANATEPLKVIDPSYEAFYDAVVAIHASISIVAKICRLEGVWLKRACDAAFDCVLKDMNINPSDVEGN